MQTLKQMNRCLQALWLRLLVPQLVQLTFNTGMGRKSI